MRPETLPIAPLPHCTRGLGWVGKAITRTMVVAPSCCFTACLRCQDPLHSSTVKHQGYQAPNIPSRLQTNPTASCRRGGTRQQLGFSVDGMDKKGMEGPEGH